MMRTQSAGRFFAKIRESVEQNGWPRFDATMYPIQTGEELAGDGTLQSVPVYNAQSVTVRMTVYQGDREREGNPKLDGAILRWLYDIAVEHGGFVDDLGIMQPKGDPTALSRVVQIGVRFQDGGPEIPQVFTPEEVDMMGLHCVVRPPSREATR